MTQATQNDFWAAEKNAKYQRQLETPEGVLLTVTLPGHGTRAAALLLDLTFLSAATVALVIAMIFLIQGSGFFLPLFVLISGLLRNFYFLFFELKWQGQTPGKRAMGLRVVDRQGGPLLPRAIVARNLLREIEVILPISLLLAGSQGGLANLLFLLWSFIFLFFPLFNRDHMRCGDLIAGTWVIEVPKSALARDLAAAPPPSNPTVHRQDTLPRSTGEKPEAIFSFTDQQLRRYEIKHLRLLEEVLRRHDSPETDDLKHKVAVNIARKIDYEPKPSAGESEDFLNAFYIEFRNRLEHSRVYGKSNEPR